MDNNNFFDEIINKEEQKENLSKVSKDSLFRVKNKDQSEKSKTDETIESKSTKRRIKICSPEMTPLNDFFKRKLSDY